MTERAAGAAVQEEVQQAIRNPGSLLPPNAEFDTSKLFPAWSLSTNTDANPPFCSHLPPHCALLSALQLSLQLIIAGMRWLRGGGASGDAWHSPAPRRALAPAHGALHFNGSFGGA